VGISAWSSSSYAATPPKFLKFESIYLYNLIRCLQPDVDGRVPLHHVVRLALSLAGGNEGEVEAEEGTSASEPCGSMRLFLEVLRANPRAASVPSADPFSSKPLALTLQCRTFSPLPDDVATSRCIAVLQAMLESHPDCGRHDVAVVGGGQRTWRYTPLHSVLFHGNTRELRGAVGALLPFGGGQVANDLGERPLHIAAMRMVEPDILTMVANCHSNHKNNNDNDNDNHNDYHNNAIYALDRRGRTPGSYIWIRFLEAYAAITMFPHPPERPLFPVDYTRMRYAMGPEERRRLGTEALRTLSHVNVTRPDVDVLPNLKLTMPGFREFWPRCEVLLRASWEHGRRYRRRKRHTAQNIQQQKDEDSAPPSILHMAAWAASSKAVPHGVLEMVLRMYSHLIKKKIHNDDPDAHDLDEDVEGWLPLHCAAAGSAMSCDSHNRRSEDSPPPRATSSSATAIGEGNDRRQNIRPEEDLRQSSAVRILLARFPEGARVYDDMCRLPLHLALEAEGCAPAPREERNPFAVCEVEDVEDLLAAHPRSIECREGREGLHPFMLAAVGEGVSLQRIYQLLHSCPTLVAGGVENSWPGDCVADDDGHYENDRGTSTTAASLSSSSKGNSPISSYRPLVSLRTPEMVEEGAPTMPMMLDTSSLVLMGTNQSTCTTN